MSCLATLGTYPAKGTCLVSSLLGSSFMRDYVLPARARPRNSRCRGTSLGPILPPPEIRASARLPASLARRRGATTRTGRMERSTTPRRASSIGTRTRLTSPPRRRRIVSLPGEGQPGVAERTPLPLRRRDSALSVRGAPDASSRSRVRGRRRYVGHIPNARWKFGHMAIGYHGERLSTVNKSMRPAGAVRPAGCDKPKVAYERQRRPGSSGTVRV